MYVSSLWRLKVVYDILKFLRQLLKLYTELDPRGEQQDILFSTVPILLIYIILLISGYQTFFGNSFIV